MELDLDDTNLEQVVDDIFQLSLKSHVYAELNLARFIRSMGIRRQNMCLNLVAELSAYRETIR